MSDLHGNRAVMGIDPADALPYGVAIARLSDGGPAAHAGLQAGDVVLAVSNRLVRTVSELTDTLGEQYPGDRVEVRVERDGKPLRLTLLLAGSPRRYSN